MLYAGAPSSGTGNRNPGSRLVRMMIAIRYRAMGGLLHQPGQWRRRSACRRDDHHLTPIITGNTVMTGLGMGIDVGLNGAVSWRYNLDINVTAVSSDSR